MPRIIIHPKDVSALGLIAQQPARHEALSKNLSKDARKIAYVLGGRLRRRKRSGYTRQIVATAEYLSKWAGDAPQLAVPAAARLSWSSSGNGRPTVAKKKAAKKKSVRK